MPSLIAHRGYPSRCPENTLASFEAAVGSGARYVEIDVQLTSDGVPVVFHDDALQRLCGVPGRITEVPVERILQFRVGGEPVPTLLEMASSLQRFPGVHLFVELKQESIDVAGEAAFLATVMDALEPVRSQCTLISFNAEVLRLAMARGWSSGWVTAAWPDSLPEGLEQGLDIWFCDVAALSHHHRLDRLGIPVAVYEVSDPKLAKDLADRGSTYIETNDIGGMRRSLAGWT